jgi:hypothetical protein
MVGIRGCGQQSILETLSRSTYELPMSSMRIKYIHFIYLYLVGGLNPREKYEFVNWEDDIPN